MVDDKIKVLYVEQYPRWEFKYVQAALVRDRRIAAKFLLLEGDDSIARGPTRRTWPSSPAARKSCSSTTW